jgi:Chaperone of endosialidase
MKTLDWSSLVCFAAIAAMGPAYAKQPPDVVKSDKSYNTAMGASALLNLDGGIDDTASGDSALFANTTGYNNTASGFAALYNNSIGHNNTASGAYALNLNSTGDQNTAAGYLALYANSTGSENTATGMQALYSNTAGGDNTAAGYNALYSNTTGEYNTASGETALYANTTGKLNTAFGVNALHNTTTGDYNTASGVDALYSNTTGSFNISAGYRAGFNLTSGSNNIDIGNVGVAGDIGKIRIGTTSTQRAAFIAGIYGTSVSGSAVMVSSSGQLGVAVSSERYKTGIVPMGSNTAKLTQLRPVTFHLKSDPNGTLQYGLIAEEVAQVYPELVVRDENGRIDGVRYDELAPMLLNEVQREQHDVAARDRHSAAQDVQISQLRQQLADVYATLARIQGKDR